MNAYKALAESDEAISRAIALLAHVLAALCPSDEVLRECLTSAALEWTEALEQPEVETLCVLGLGAFCGVCIPHPVQAVQLQRAKADAAA